MDDEGPGTGALDVEGFARARERELGGLGRALGAAAGRRGWGAGALPRGLRRRARSHAPRRGGKGRRPNRKRELARQAGGEVPPEPRATRRRRARLIEPGESGGPGPGGVRLETHLWAAKRMTMGVLGGLAVAEGWAGRGQGGRHLHHLLRTGCCLLDGSLCAATELAGPREEVLSVLAALGDVPRPELEAASGEVLLTLRSASLEGTQPAICPATVTLRAPPSRADEGSSDAVGSQGDASGVSWIWVHCAASEEAQEAILAACKGTAVRVIPRGSSLRRLELRGYTSSACLATVLGRAAQNGRTGVETRLEGVSSGGETLHLEVPDPRMSSPGEMRLLQEVGGAMGGLWVDEGPPSGPGAQAALDLARRDLRSALLVDEGELPALQKSLAGRSTSPCPVALVRKIGSLKATSGWSLIVPRGWVMPFWTKLVLEGAVPCGQREWRWAASIDGACSFPHDFPDSAAFARLEGSRIAAARQGLLKKPKAKRGGAGLPEPSSLVECTAGETRPRAGLLCVVSRTPHFNGGADGNVTRLSPNHFLRVSVRLCGRGTAALGDTVHCPAPGDEGTWRADAKVLFSCPEGRSAANTDSSARRRIGFISSALPPGLDRNHAHATAVCHARALESLAAGVTEGLEPGAGKIFVLVRCGTRSGVNEGTLRPALLQIRAGSPGGDRVFV